MTRWSTIWRTATCGLALSATLVAQSESAAPSAEEQAAMEAFAKAAAPGPQHAWLAGLAGTWTFRGTFWGTPGAEPVVSEGRAVRTALLGGRVVREELTSTIWGQPFEGIGHSGYDNVTGTYWSTWFDNMATSLMVSSGACEAGVCTYEATNSDPMTGKIAKSRMVSRHEADREHHEVFGPGPDGREFKMMEFDYTRE